MKTKLAVVVVAVVVVVVVVVVPAVVVVSSLSLLSFISILPLQECGRVNSCHSRWDHRPRHSCQPSPDINTHAHIIIHMKKMGSKEILQAHNIG